MARASDGREIHRAAREPRTPELAKRAVPHQQTTHARGIAEHLVEGHADEFRADALQVETIGRNKRGGIEQHIPPVSLRVLHELEGMLDPGEIGLRGKRKEIVAAGIGAYQEVSRARVHQSAAPAS